jgi:hypothetical protein
MKICEENSNLVKLEQKYWPNYVKTSERCTVILLYCYTVVLLYCCTVILLYCYTVVLMYCCIVPDDIKLLLEGCLRVKEYHTLRLDEEA